MIKNLFVLSAFLMLFSALNVQAETVVFNTKTLKYHKPGCQWAIKCTVNCIRTEKQQAIRNGGRPCKVCHYCPVKISARNPLP